MFLPLVCIPLQEPRSGPQIHGHLLPPTVIVLKPGEPMPPSAIWDGLDPAKKEIYPLVKGKWTVIPQSDGSIIVLSSQIPALRQIAVVRELIARPERFASRSVSTLADLGEVSQDYFAEEIRGFLPTHMPAGGKLDSKTRLRLMARRQLKLNFGDREGTVGLPISSPPGSDPDTIRAANKTIGQQMDEFPLRMVNPDANKNFREVPIGLDFRLAGEIDRKQPWEGRISRAQKVYEDYLKLLRNELAPAMERFRGELKRLHGGDLENTSGMQFDQLPLDIRGRIASNIRSQYRSYGFESADAALAALSRAQVTGDTFGADLISTFEPSMDYWVVRVDP